MNIEVAGDVGQVASNIDNSVSVDMHIDEAGTVDHHISIGTVYGSLHVHVTVGAATGNGAPAPARRGKKKAA